ncbi:MAG: hypothetical protein CL749_02480, partial [Chloroflexi bacterium]|nr:hypothetical protein [Chloroflexota bacterium]
VHQVTSDGIPLAGALIKANKGLPKEAISVVLFLHADGGNFYSPLYLSLGETLAKNGITFLSANRRGHDIISHGARGGPPRGYAFESVSEAPIDYEAWISLLKDRGHNSVAIGGHSGGAVRAIYSQALGDFPEVKAVLAISPGEYNHNLLRQLHRDDFTFAFEHAMLEVSSGRPDTLLKPGVPWSSTWTAKAFTDCFNPDNRYQVSVHAKSIDVPVLFTFGELETEFGGDQELPVCGLAMRTIEKGNFDFGKKLTLKVVTGANHSYFGRENDLARTILEFIKVVN